MWAATFIGLTLCLAGCTRVSDESWMGWVPDVGLGWCEKAMPSGTVEPQLIAANVKLLGNSLPLRWISPNAHVYELDMTTLGISDLGDEDHVKGPLWDDHYWYRTRCFELCDNTDSFGIPLGIERIDRVTGQRVRLGRGSFGLGDLTLAGDYVYWGVFAHETGGGVERVKKSGGTDERVELRTTKDEDQITNLAAYPDGVLVLGWDSIGWIPGNGKPRTIATGLRSNAAVLDDNMVFAADAGGGARDSSTSGSIRRLSLLDGTDTKLAELDHEPSAIATYGPNVYFTLPQSTEIWSVPKSGGLAWVVLKPRPRTPCNESKELWATDRGLLWTDGGALDLQRALYFAPWAALSVN